ncbi:MAG: hypothetical protein L6R35_005382 [Caloplaca aegaea]|nr:MAG: hypothetical protein L6R35_005382 [Caloplaca aegaea]
MQNTKSRECTYTAPEKRRRRKRTDTRVAELEHMVQMLAARLEEEQRPRAESGQEKRDLARSRDVTGRRPSSSSPMNPVDQGGMHQEPAPPATTSASLASQSHPMTSSPADSPSISPPIMREPSKPLSKPPQTPHPISPPFLPSQCLDYTKRASLPTSLQLGSWPDYLSPSLQQASGPEDIYSPHPSPSQSGSFASTASPSTEPWPSPELDFESLYAGSCLMDIDGCMNDVGQDPGMWWAGPEGGDSLDVQAQGLGVPQGWDLPWGVV